MKRTFSWLFIAGLMLVVACEKQSMIPQVTEVEDDQVIIARIVEMKERAQNSLKSAETINLEGTDIADLEGVINIIFGDFDTQTEKDTVIMVEFDTPYQIGSVYTKTVDAIRSSELKFLYCNLQLHDETLFVTLKFDMTTTNLKSTNGWATDGQGFRIHSPYTTTYDVNYYASVVNYVIPLNPSDGAVYKTGAVASMVNACYNEYPKSAPTGKFWYDIKEELSGSMTWNRDYSHYETERIEWNTAPITYTRDGISHSMISTYDKVPFQYVLDANAGLITGVNKYDYVFDWYNPYTPPSGMLRTLDAMYTMGGEFYYITNTDLLYTSQVSASYWKPKYQELLELNVSKVPYEIECKLVYAGRYIANSDTWNNHTVFDLELIYEHSNNLGNLNSNWYKRIAPVYYIQTARAVTTPDYNPGPA